MTEQSKLKFLLSGPGLIGKRHAELIGQNENCTLAAIVAPPSDENLSFAEHYQTPLFPDIRTALKTIDIDAAIISSPNQFHFDQVSDCINSKIPVLVEKPITDDIETAYDLVKRGKKAGVPILVGHHRTYSPLTKAALEFLSSKKFGKMVVLQGSALFYKPAHYFLDGPWRKFIGGGPILINLIHEIGLMRMFAGEIVEVQALASNRTRQFEVEDSVVINLRFANGALGSFVLSDVAASSKSWEMTSGENKAYPFFPDETCYHFAGTHGSLDFPSMKARYYQDEDKRSWWTNFRTEDIAFTRQDPLVLQLQHFIDVIKNNVRPLVSAYDGYKNMVVLDAVQNSIKNGDIVKVIKRF